MKTKELFNRWKVHFLFGGGFFIVLAVNVIINSLNGETVPQAALAALRAIRPMDYLMFALFWYALTRGKESDSRSRFTSLNLNSSKD